jgi:hypothetical protein
MGTLSPCTCDIVRHGAKTGRYAWCSWKTRYWRGSDIKEERELVIQVLDAMIAKHNMATTLKAMEG